MKSTIRTFKTRDFTVVIDALPDEIVDTSWDDTGETRAKIESGEYVAFCVRARVMHRTLGEIASDYLGGCIYADPAEFQDHRECAAATRDLRANGSTAVCGSYFADMVRTVCADARKAIRAARDIKVRP